MTAQKIDEVAAAELGEEAAPARSFWRSASRDRLLVISAAIVGVYVVLALIGPYVTPKDPFQSHAGLNFQGPGAQYWFGADKEGRDVLSRLIYGTRYTLLGAFGVMLIATVGGLLYGLVTAYVGGWFDAVSMRVFDVILSIPPLIVAMLLVAAFGPGLYAVVVGVGIGYLPAIARIIRSEALVQVSQQYTAAGRGLGFSAPRMIFRHIMPNTTSQIVVQASMNLPYAIIDIAGLSFLGFGIRPPTPDWGTMLAEGQNAMLFAPWLVIFPGIAVTLLVVTWNVFGSRLRRILDPRQLL
jgi:peptide/nickel transport system permease protein